LAEMPLLYVSSMVGQVPATLPNRETPIDHDSRQLFARGCHCWVLLISPRAEAIAPAPPGPQAGRRFCSGAIFGLATRLPATQTQIWMRSTWRIASDPRKSAGLVRLRLRRSASKCPIWSSPSRRSEVVLRSNVSPLRSFGDDLKYIAAELEALPAQGGKTPERGVSYTGIPFKELSTRSERRQRACPRKDTNRRRWFYVQSSQPQTSP
jgi:hypothetical protein